MRDGHKLIQRMLKLYKLEWWSSCDLIKFILEGNNREVTLHDPKKVDDSIELNGKFSIEEIDAILIAQLNDRGRMG